MTLFKLLLITIFLATCQPAYSAGTFIKGPALIEGFNTVTSAAGTTTLTKDSETKQILTGATTQTFVLPDATTLPLGRYFNMINKSSGVMTIQTSGGGALTTVDPGVQKEVHLRAAGSAAGTWDVLAGGGGGVWGSITGTLSSQTDLQAALDLKAPLASPTFTGTIGTPLTVSKLLATDASGNLTATAANSSQASYLDFSSSGQTQLNGKLGLSNFTAKGDIVAGVSSGTVSSLTLGGEGSYLLSDPNNITNGIRWGTPSGLTNYIKQSQAEGGVTTGWATYADAAGTSPVDGTGGSPNSTFSTTSANPLRGSNSFTFTLRTGASRQGEGVCYPITIDRADTQVPKQQKIEFDYEITSGTFVAGSMTDLSSAGDSTLTVWVVDTTSGQVIQPSTYRLYSNVGDHYSGYFQNNYGSASYRVCLHKGTSTTVSGSNIVVKLDEFKTAPSTYLAGTPISDDTIFTASGQGFGTIGTQNIKWSRIGDKMRIYGRMTVGTTTSAEARINLPFGTIDSTKVNVTQAVGRWTRNLANTSVIEYVVLAQPGASYLNIGFRTSTDTPLALGQGIQVADSSGAVSFDAEFPIQGWSASTQMSDGYDSREISLRATNNSSTTLATSGDTLIPYTLGNGTTYDKVSCLSSSICTVASSGRYRVSAKVFISGGQSWTNGDVVTLYAKVDNTTYYPLGSFAAQATQTLSNAFTVGGNVTLDLTAGQTIRIVSNNVLAATKTTQASVPNYNSFEVEKLQSPQTMSATEVVAASYQVDGGGQSLTSTAVLQFNTKVFDTHNAVTTGSSWKFTAPVPGIYELSYKMMQVNNTGTSCQLTMRKNAVAIYRSQPAAIVNGPATVITNQMMQADTVMFSLNAGDYIDVYINSASAAGSVYTTTSDSWINIKRIK